MDRRQRKTREAIFKAFTDLLSTKKYNNITVSEIIEIADVGRATFYSHFETKDLLLNEFCKELFCHIFDCLNDDNSHKHIFNCKAPDSDFLHLFIHIKNNDNNLLKLLSCRNNELFLDYFKKGMCGLVKSMEISGFDDLPEDFIVNYIASTFVETVKWWIDNKMIQSPDEINRFFMTIM